MSFSASRSARKPARTRPWSSTIRTRIMPLHREAASPTPESRRRHGARLRAIALTQQAERRAQLLECFLAGLVDRDESAPGLVRSAIEQVSPDTGLDADHRDPMGQDIVQLARDSNALLTSPPVGLVLAAPLGVERSLLDLFEIGSAAACGLTEDEAGDEPAGEPQGGDE